MAAMGSGGYLGCSLCSPRWLSLDFFADGLVAVFHASLYVRVRGIDESAERCGVCGCLRAQLHMAHALAGALQQTGRIGQRGAVKEPHVYMGSKHIDVAEGRISETGDRTAVM